MVQTTTKWMQNLQTTMKLEKSRQYLATVEKEKGSHWGGWDINQEQNKDECKNVFNSLCEKVNSTDGFFEEILKKIKSWSNFTLV